VLSDRALIDVMWSHVGNNFALDLQDPSLYDVQPSIETTTGLWGRSYNASIFMRPTNSLDVVSTYFMPATAGGDHSFKFGYRWRSAHSTSINHRGGFIEARFTNNVANAADIYRDQYSESHLDTHAFYVQDTFTRNRLTVNLGFRVDRQDESAAPGPVPENPHFPTIMPAINFPGVDSGVVWTDFSPPSAPPTTSRATAAPSSRRRTRPTTARCRPASSRTSSPPPARCSCATPGPTPTATGSCSRPKSTPRCRS
jgi:hypothetical protein